MPNSIKKNSQITIEKDFSYGWAAAIASIAIAGQAFPGLSSVLHSNLFRKASLVDLHFWHSCDNTVYSLWRNETKVDYGGKGEEGERRGEREGEKEGENNTIGNWYLKIMIINHLSKNSNVVVSYIAYRFFPLFSSCLSFLLINYTF